MEVAGDELAALGEAGTDHWTEPRMGVNNGQDMEHVARGELVVGETHRPAASSYGRMKQACK